MTILVDNAEDDCNRGIGEPMGKGEVAAAAVTTRTIAVGNFDENANLPPSTIDAKQCTFREHAMDNTTITAAAITSGDPSGDNDQLDEESPPAFAEVDNVVTTGIKRSEAGSIPFSILQDPLTNMRMVDPVVNPAGDSYERLSLLLTDESIEFYPNRALQAILKHQDDYEKCQHTTSASDPSNDSLAAANANGWWFHDPIKHPSPPLPEAFYCPITCDIMVDPWIGPDGSTYEYDGIEAWLAQSDRDACSPVTRQALSLGQLRPNHALYELIQWETQRPPSERHAAVQRWIESTPNTKRTPRPNHPLPLAVTPLLPGTSTTQPSSQNATSRPDPATQVASGTTNSIAALEETSGPPWWINLFCVVILLILIFVFVPLRIALLIAFAIAFFMLCHCSCTVSH
jgi:U-box domain